MQYCCGEEDDRRDSFSAIDVMGAPSALAHRRMRRARRTTSVGSHLHDALKQTAGHTNALGRRKSRHFCGRIDRSISAYI